MNKFTSELSFLQSAWESIPDDEIVLSELSPGDYNAQIKSCIIIKAKDGRLFLKWIFKIEDKYILKMSGLNEKQIFYARRDIETVLGQKLEHASDIELVIDKMTGIKIQICISIKGKYKDISIVKLGWDEFPSLKNDVESAFNNDGEDAPIL